MFKNKKKVEFNEEELTIMLHALNEFRTQLLNENKYIDVVNEVMVKLKSKMKVDKYDLGVMINGLDQKREVMHEKGEDTSAIVDLLSKLLKIYKNL